MKNTDKREIGALVKALNRSTVWAYGFYLKYRFGKYDNIASDYTHGYVDENEMVLLIRKSISFTFVQWMLPRIINMTDSACFTDKVIDVCVGYPSDWRDTLLEAVGHKSLSVKNLTRINRLMHTPEAFYGLLVYYLTQNVDTDTFERFLRANNRFRTELIEHGQCLIERNKTADNAELIRILLSWRNEKT